MAGKERTCGNDGRRKDENDADGHRVSDCANGLQRCLPIVVSVCLLIGCSESGTRSPTAPNPPPPLAAAFAPAADTAVDVQFTVEIQTGQTVRFTIEITGGDPDAQPVWTCASADTTVALAPEPTLGAPPREPAVALPPSPRPSREAQRLPPLLSAFG